MLLTPLPSAAAAVADVAAALAAAPIMCGSVSKSLRNEIVGVQAYDAHLSQMTDTQVAVEKGNIAKSTTGYV